MFISWKVPPRSGQLFSCAGHADSSPENPAESTWMNRNVGKTWQNMVRQCHKPARTGNGKFIPPIKMVMPGGWILWPCFAHIINNSLEK